MTVPGASGTLELGSHSDIAVNFDLAPWRWPAGSSTSELKSTQLQSPLSTEPFLIVCTTELSDVGTQLSRPATWASEAPEVCLPRGGCPGQADFGISLLCACTNAIPWGCGWTVSIFLHWRHHNLRSSWIWASFMSWLFFFLMCLYSVHAGTDGREMREPAHGSGAPTWTGAGRAGWPSIYCVSLIRSTLLL